MLVVVEIGVFPLICGWWLDICSLVRTETNVIKSFVTVFIFETKSSGEKRVVNEFEGALCFHKTAFSERMGFFKYCLMLMLGFFIL